MTKQNEEKLDLVAVSLHEFKTALTGIIVSAELLDDELRPDSKSVMGRLIQSIIRNAHSIDERLSFLSETGGLLAPNSQFQPELLKIGQVIHNVAAQLYPGLQSKRQSLTLAIPNSLPQVKADRKHLE